MSVPDVLASPDVFTFHAPTRVVHGRGAIARLGDEVARDCRRPLLVTDPGIVASGLHRRAVESLERRGLAVAVFDGVSHMATVGSVENGVAAGRAHGFDCVVGLGGGSALAVARGVAIVGAEERPVRDLVGGWGAEPPSLRILPLYSVPTTAGSGSEVSPNAPLVDQEVGAKLTLGGPATFSRVAILDPDLLASLPPRQAALSGVDALTHAIEACCTNLATPITDALALSAMRILVRDLAAAVRGDADARARCLVASTMANQACANAKLGLVHGLARNVQALFTIPYGVTIGVFLVPVMEFNRPAATEQFARMAVAMGLAGDSAAADASAAAVVPAVKRLLAAIGIPRRFEPDEVDRPRIDQLARMVFARNTPAQLDPAALASLDVAGFAPSPNIRRARYADVVALYECALEGWTVEAALIPQSPR